MAPRTNDPMQMETTDRQRQYVQAQKARGTSVGIVFADAFLRGMRDLGYKSPAWAIAELIDNAIQAGASCVSVLFGYNADNKKQSKPDKLAIVDDGVGMIPEMITYSVMWGGTDRENDRTGFGRYGYGLPSSAVSIAKRYMVYSRSKGNGWHAVTVDIDALSEVASDPNKTRELLSPRPAKLPEWVVESSNDVDLAAEESGTVIVLEEPDRLRRLGGWILTKSLEQKLLQSFGTIYRHWIPARRMSVNGVQVEPVDPLFLMEHGRYFGDNRIRATRVDTRAFDLDFGDGETGVVTLRASVLPPNFQLADPTQYGKKGAKLLKGRWDVMRSYNGLLICREGRQIDCINPRFTKFQTYDANVKIEIDFDAALDEFFGITTSKQQIVIDDVMWEKLENTGKDGGALRALVTDMRRAFKDMQEELSAEAENQEDTDEPRPSESAMEASHKFVKTRVEPTPEQKKEAETNLEEHAEEVARVTGKPKQEVVQKLEEVTRGKRWDVKFQVVEEGPFYLPKRLGQQKRVIINTGHPFYSRLYEPADRDARAVIEVLFLVLAEAELDADGDRLNFYKAARQTWSERLRYALQSFGSETSLEDKASRIAEELYMEAEAQVVSE